MLMVFFVTLQVLLCAGSARPAGGADEEGTGDEGRSALSVPRSVSLSSL